MGESSGTQKSVESKILDPELFPPNRGFEYKIGTKLDAQDELKKWYAAKITDIQENEGLLMIHFEYWSQRFDELIPANSARLRPSSVPEKKCLDTLNVGDYVHAKWGHGFTFPAKITEILDDDRYKLLYYDGFVKIVKKNVMKKMSPGEIQELDFDNFGKLTLMPSYPNPLFDPEIGKKVTGKRLSAFRKPEDHVSVETVEQTPETKSPTEESLFQEVSKTNLKPLPKRPHSIRPDLTEAYSKRRGPRDPLEEGDNVLTSNDADDSSSVSVDKTSNIRHTRAIIDAANKTSAKKGKRNVSVESDSSKSVEQDVSASSTVAKKGKKNVSVDSEPTKIDEQNVSDENTSSKKSKRKQSFEPKTPKVEENLISTETVPKIKRKRRTAAEMLAFRNGEKNVSNEKTPKKKRKTSSIEPKKTTKVLSAEDYSPEQQPHMVGADGENDQQTPQLVLLPEAPVSSSKAPKKNIEKIVDALKGLPPKLDVAELPIVEVVDQQKPAEDKKALRKAAMGVAFAVAKLTPSTRAKRTSVGGVTQTTPKALSTPKSSPAPLKKVSTPQLKSSPLKIIKNSPAPAKISSPPSITPPPRLTTPIAESKSSPASPQTPLDQSQSPLPLQEESPPQLLSSLVQPKSSPSQFPNSPPRLDCSPNRQTPKATTKRPLTESPKPNKEPKLDVEKSLPDALVVEPTDTTIDIASENGEQAEILPPPEKPPRKHAFAHRNRKRRNRFPQLSSKSKATKSFLSKRWYQTASNFKPEWRVGREDWLQYDGALMYCKPCRERYYPGQKGHNSGFVDGIGTGFVVNRIFSHEISSAHVAAINSPTRKHDIIPSPNLLFKQTPKFKKKIFAYKPQVKTSKKHAVVEKLETKQKNFPTKQKTFPVVARMPGPPRLSNSCHFPKCGLSFDTSDELRYHVQMSHQKKVKADSSKPPKLSKKCLDDSMTMSDSDSYVSEESSTMDALEDADGDNEFDDERKTNSTGTSLSHLAEDDLVRCICGDTEENGMMVQCEQCSMWQHGACFNQEDSATIPVNYSCYMCKNPIGVRKHVRDRFLSNKSWNESGELPVFACVSDQRRDDEVKMAANNRAMSKICQNVIQLRDNLRSVRFRILVANTPNHPLLQKVVPFDHADPTGESEARECLRQDITRLQDEIEINLDSIDEFVTAYESGHRSEHDFEDLNAANVFTSELMKNLTKVRKMTFLLQN